MIKLRRLFVGIPLLRPGFDPSSGHVGSVVNKVVLSTSSPSSSVSLANSHYTQGSIFSDHPLIDELYIVNTESVVKYVKIRITGGVNPVKFPTHCPTVMVTTTFAISVEAKRSLDLIKRHNLWPQQYCRVSSSVKNVYFGSV